MPTINDLQVASYQIDSWEDLIDVTLERCRQRTGPDRWAIREKGCCLGKDGMWILEPIPSSRDDDFFSVYRWASAESALEFWTNNHCHSRFEQYRRRISIKSDRAASTPVTSAA